MKPYIVTDSTADFPKGFQFDDFAIMQMRYMLDDEEFDGVEKKLTAKQFYERMKAGAKSNTSMLDELTLRGTIEPLLKEGSIARAKQLAGPDPTYNNVNDANAALELVKEFDEPAVVACKHGVPCGAGTGSDLYEAFERAAEADPLRLRGGILAVNGVVDARIAASLRDMGVEAVVAVGFTPEAMAELRFNKALILLEMPDIRSKVQFSTFDMKKIYGGLLVQTYDAPVFEKARCVTKRKPTVFEVKALELSL